MVEAFFVSQIHIVGGVTLLRAAAKNHERLTILCDPTDYASVVTALNANGKVSEDMRKTLALKAFTHTADYDTAISGYFRSVYAPQQQMTLRYGVNPHQKPAEVFTTHVDLPFKGALSFLASTDVSSPFWIPRLY